MNFKKELVQAITNGLENSKCVC